MFLKTRCDKERNKNCASMNSEIMEKIPNVKTFTEMRKYSMYYLT
jgi:hypothetical protein